MSIYYGPVPTTEEKRRGTQLPAIEMVHDIERLTGRDTTSIITQAQGSQKWDNMPEPERQEAVLEVWKKMIGRKYKKGQGSTDSGPKNIAEYYGGQRTTVLN